MAAPILWVSGIFWFFLQENLHAHNLFRFRGGGILGFLGRGGGGEVSIIFMVADIFLNRGNQDSHPLQILFCNFCGMSLCKGLL